MNRSWRNTSNNTSTGFVYFNTGNSNYSPNSQHSLDSPEFLSFGSDSSPGTSPHVSQFTPSNYSSPRKFYGGKSPRQRGGRNQYYTPTKQTGGKFWRKSLGLTGSAEMNVSNTNTYSNFVENHYNESGQHQTHKKQKSFHHNAPNQRYNASVFYDPTCLQDPWAELEQKLADDRKKEEESLVESQSSQSQSQSLNIEAEETRSEVSESEDDSDEMEESFS